jgi:hypothetical protein
VFEYTEDTMDVSQFMEDEEIYAPEDVIDLGYEDEETEEVDAAS